MNPARPPSMLVAALALLGSAAATGCDEDVKYGYFSVKVTIADTATPEYLGRIASCGVNVEGSDTDFTPLLGCKRGQVTSKELGTLEWSTNTTGAVRFVVRLTDVTDTELGSGMTGDLTIIPDDTVTSSLVVTPTPAALMPGQ